MTKTLVALAMITGAVAALAVPASASASWLHHATPIQQNVQLGLTGQTRFQGGLGGVECQVTSSLQLLVGQTVGKIATYAFHPTSDTTNCKGLGGLAFCQLHNTTPQNLPWTLHPAEIEGQDQLRITNVSVTGQATGGFCPIKKTTLTGSTVIGTPNQPNTVSSMQLSGKAQVDIETTNGTTDQETATVGGTMNIESPNASTYSM